MTLHLDVRQRAMLKEMGVRIWWPSEVPAAAAVQAPGNVGSAHNAPHTLQQVPAAAPTSVPGAAAAQILRRLATASLRPSPTTTASAIGATTPLVLSPPQALYPEADPQKMLAKLGNAWLIVAEGPLGTGPLAKDASLLLHNMLYALGLHRHPRVFLSTVTPQTIEAPPAPSCTQVLAEAMDNIQPCVVLVMGRMAARAVLGRSDPLGQLRAQPHTVAGRHTIVTYEAAYLLRARPQIKAAAWADLCRALALASTAIP